MLKKSILISLAATATLLSGCASVSVDSAGKDLSKLDTHIQLNQTTLSDVRAFLGTPTTIATTEINNEKVVGYALAGHNTAAVFARNFGKSAATLGFGAKSREYTVKNIYFKLDNNDVVVDYKKSGVSYITKNRFTFWNECERKLTDSEVQLPVYYNREEICSLYAQDVAKKEGIAESEVDTGKEFEFCNLPCQNLRGAIEAFGSLKDVHQSDVASLEGDGSLSDSVWK